MQERGAGGGCHPALGRLINWNTVSGNVADSRAFVFALVEV